MKKFFLCLFLMLGLAARAELQIDVSGAKREPIPVAIPYFISTDSNNKLARQITDVVVADLERSGLFRLVDRDAYIQRFTDIDTKPTFSDWQVINAHALVQGAVSTDPMRGQIQVSFRLWDVFAGTQMEAQVMTTKENMWRKMAHMVADSLYERLTGEKGYFNTAVVFVSETGGQKKRKKRLAIMDQDGENLKYLTDGKWLVMTPRFSPDMKEIAYFSFKNGKPKVYLMDLATNQERELGDFKGMTFAPRFSPDGKKMVLSLEKGGNTEIYIYDLNSKNMTQLTNHPAIDTSPTFSPDGKRVVFSSDRSGRQNLYIVPVSGGEPVRISFGEGSYATPVWSPRGDYIAFTKIWKGNFHIGIMRTDGSGERLITSGFLVDSPTWAPNGRTLMFYRKEPYSSWGFGGASSLYSIDITGYNEQKIKTPHDASAPFWSGQL